MNNDIVVTGMGVVTPIGASVERFWDANLRGESGLVKESRMDLSDLPCGWVAGLIPDDIKAPIQRTYGRADRSWCDMIMHSAVDQALADARCGGKLGPLAGLVWCRVWPGPSGSFPADYAQRFRDIAQREQAFGKDGRAMAAHLRSQKFELEVVDHSTFPRDIAERLDTPLVTTRIEATCSGGLRAIAEAARLLRTGKVEFAIVTASVSRNTPYVMSQYAQLMATSRWKGDPKQASMPFDKRRCGMVINESAGAIVLETAEHARRRGVDTVHAVVNGWGLAVDTGHVTAPDSKQIERVMSTALRESGLAPGDIDVVNAHGTSTRLNDAMESRALHAVFGDHMNEIDVCAVKSLTGHGSAASGILETVVSALSLCRGVVPPVVTCEEPDPDCNVRTSRTPVERPVKRVLKNSFGFGGQYASMVFSRPENPRLP